MHADILAAYGGYDHPPTGVDMERPTQVDGTQEQALRGHAAPRDEREQRYDTASNLAARFRATGPISLGPKHGRRSRGRRGQ